MIFTWLGQPRLRSHFQDHRSWGFYYLSLQGFKYFYSWLHMCQSTFTIRYYPISLNPSVFHIYCHSKINITKEFPSHNVYVHKWKLEVWLNEIMTSLKLNKNCILSSKLKDNFFFNLLKFEFDWVIYCLNWKLAVINFLHIIGSPLAFIRFLFWLEQVTIML